MTVSQWRVLHMKMIGLMGVSDNGVMFSPKGRRLFRLPLRLAALIQRAQHWIAQRTWR